jgi:toxin ParE1/3/4
MGSRSDSIKCHPALGLGEAPCAFPFIPRYQHLGIRRRRFRDYLIFYRIDDERLYIVRVLHGARDYEAVLFPGS